MADSDVDLRESSFIAFPPAEMEGESGEFTGNNARDVRMYVDVLDMLQLCYPTTWNEICTHFVNH